MNLSLHLCLVNLEDIWKFRTINTTVGLDKWCKQGTGSTSCFCVCLLFVKHNNLGTPFPRTHYLFLLTESPCFSIIKASYHTCFGCVAFFMVNESRSLFCVRTSQSFETIHLIIVCNMGKHGKNGVHFIYRIIKTIL